MLNKITIVIGILMGSVLAAWGASSTLSGLPAGTSIAGTDLFYDVQTVGVGGVKVTGTQFLSFVFGQVSGNCTASNAGVFSCTGGNATGIAAGTNISTSGTGTNVTINVISTPTFSSVTSTFANITGWLTAGGFNAQTATLAGNLTGTTANFSGGVTISGNLTATTAQFAGFLTASGASLQTATIAGNLTGASANFSTSLTADTLQATGFLSASGANFTSLTVTGLTPTGPVCLQEVNGLIQANNSACSAPQLSIAAGTNISTSGTATNITVNVINNPVFTALTATASASFPVQLTAGGVSFNTAVIAGNLTGSTAQFTGALTGTTAVFQTITDTGITGSTQCVQASTTGLLSGTGSTCGSVSIAAGTNIATTGTASNITVSTILTPTFTSLTSTNGSITTLTGGTATFQTITINSLTPTGPNCLQESGGVVQATNSACSAAGGTPGGVATDVQILSPTGGTFGGDSGFTYAGNLGVVSIVPSASLAGLSLTLGSLTTNTKGINIIGTWASTGITFDAPLFENITDSGSASRSLLADFQVGSASQAGIRKDGVVFTNVNGGFAQDNTGATNAMYAPGATRSDFYQQATAIFSIYPTSVTPGVAVLNSGLYAWSSTASSFGARDTGLYRGGAGVVALAVPNSVTSATAIRTYNTVDVPTAPVNFERGIADWLTTTNAYTIGTQAGGTGIGRTMNFVASNTIAMSISPTINLYGQTNPSANETYAVCAGSGATSLTSGGQVFVDTTACLASSMMVKHDIAAFNTYGMDKLGLIARPLHAENRLASIPIDVDPIAEAMALIPVVATYDNIDHNSPQFTLIAQNACQVDERLCERTEDGSVRAFRPNAVISILVAAIQKQQADIEELKRRIH